MFHTAWMYRGLESRRSRKGTNQQRHDTRNRSASEATGSMSSDSVAVSGGCGAVESDKDLRSRDLNCSVIGGWSRSAPNGGLHEKLESTISFQNHEKSCSEDNETLDSSSHFAVLDVEESQAASEGFHEDNVKTDKNSVRTSSRSGSRSPSGSAGQPSEGSSLVEEESEDLVAITSESNSEMGNTHWSHSYTGVRQPIRMRSSCRADSAKLMEDLSEVYVPIIGYEMMEQRAKFTVFKLHVQKNSTESWFIFRRYTDFERLNGQLSYLFPNFRLALPPKKWFGNNFDPVFLEDRQLGLQAFLNNICGHKDIVVSDCVREFLCVDDPPGPHDSLEESRALCESLEETVYHLKKDLADRERKIVTLTEELANAMRRIEALTIHQINRSDRVLPLSPNGSDTTDVDRQSCAEADQQDYSPDQEERPLVPSFSNGHLKPASEAVKPQLETPPEFTTIPLDTPNTKDAPIISSSEIIEVT